MNEIIKDQQLMQEDIERFIKEQEGHPCSKSPSGTHAAYNPNLKCDIIRYWETYCIYCSRSMVLKVKNCDR